MPFVINPYRFAGGGSGAMTVDWRGQVPMTLTTTPEATSVDIGAAASDRIVYVALCSRLTDAFATLTIGGVSATLQASITSVSFGFNIQFYSAAVSSGATATISGTTSTSVPNWVHCGVWAVYGAQETPLDTSAVNNTTTLSDTLTASTSGTILAAAVSNPTGGSVVTWTSPLVEDLEINTSASDDTCSWAHGSPASASQSVDATAPTGNASITAFAAVSLQPS